jgi:prefoldin alpha subunit
MTEEKKEKQNIELERRYYDLQILGEQINELQKQSEEISSKIYEVTSAISAIGELGRGKEAEETFFPIAGGIYARGRITDSENLLLNAGADIVVERKASDVVEMLQHQLSELKKYNEEILAQIEQFSNAAAQTEQELRRMLKENPAKKKE